MHWKIIRPILEKAVVVACTECHQKLRQALTDNFDPVYEYYGFETAYERVLPYIRDKMDNLGFTSKIADSALKRIAPVVYCIWKIPSMHVPECVSPAYLDYLVQTRVLSDANSLRSIVLCNLLYDCVKCTFLDESEMHNYVIDRLDSLRKDLE